MSMLLPKRIDEVRPARPACLARRALLAVLVALASLTTAPARTADPTAAGTLVVAAVPSIAPAAATLNAEFLRQHPGTAIRVTTARSVALAAQIEAGAAIDLLLADDLALPQQLAASGRLDGGSTRVIGRGLLALWTNTPGINPGRGRPLFAADYINRIAIADPAGSPFGVIATTALDRLGVAEIATPKLQRLADDLAVAEEIKTRSSDIGLLPLPMVKAPAYRDVGLYILLPIGVYEPASYTATLSTAGSGKPLAQAYVEFLRSEAARALLAEAGFEAAE